MNCYSFAARIMVTALDIKIGAILFGELQIKDYFLECLVLMLCLYSLCWNFNRSPPVPPHT
jgi:hypothetical protein